MPATGKPGSSTVGASANGHGRLSNALKSRDAVERETKDLMHIEGLATGVALPLLIATYLVQNSFSRVDFGMIFVWGQVILCVSITVLIILWIHNGIKELDYLQTWIRTDHYRTKNHIMISFTFFILALIFSVMVFTSNMLHVFYTLYASYLLFDLYTWRLRRREFMPAIDGALRYLQKWAQAGAGNARDRTTAKIYLQAMEIILYFYYQRRHSLRIVLTFVPLALLAAGAWLFHALLVHPAGSTASVAPALRGVPLLAGSPPDRILVGPGLGVPLDVARFATCLVFVLVLIVTEYVLFRWREQMRRGLAALEVELVELAEPA